MGSFIAKQPNGLYCRFSSIVDCPTDWDMTEDEYIEMCAERGRQEARDILANHVRPFSEAVRHTHPVNMPIEKIIEVFTEMGHEPTEEEVAEWEAWGKDDQ